MGAKLEGYFDQAKAKGGMQAQVKLAIPTKMSKQQAAAQPDTPENIKLFEESLIKL